ncbi:hypothetical protein JTB14_017764 [Gonioctena quinquepunctata]|nr:hypothetical protein JTB14_017764 [Gonioctena quinquepunctata]
MYLSSGMSGRAFVDAEGTDGRSFGPDRPSALRQRQLKEWRNAKISKYHTPVLFASRLAVRFDRFIGKVAEGAVLKSLIVVSWEYAERTVLCDMSVEWKTLIFRRSMS